MPVPETPMRDLFSRAPVMPILTVHAADTAVDLAKALIDGGLPVLEVLMRTPEALRSIELIARDCPDAQVGAGTLLGGAALREARNAGAAFGVSPGLTSGLAEAAIAAEFPLLPGVSSASEVMAALDFGFREMKWFPAHGAAGIAALKMMAPVFPTVSFCPTGGITMTEMPGYLALPNCRIVGGSWVAPRELIEDKNWTSITKLAAEAVRVAGQM